MWRRLVAWVSIAVVVLALTPVRAFAHVGSPDVFLDGDAGPYHVSVTIRMPEVIPGVATIEIRAASDVAAITVVPLRLTGPGSERPPTPDRAVRSSVDPQFFTADLWLMERGALQVRVTATGARGTGTLAVPVPAAALRTRTMDTGLGALLLGCLLVLALGAVAIAGGAAREVTLPAGEAADPRTTKRARIATAIAAVLVAGLVAGGNAWWTAEARTYADQVMQPWQLQPRVVGCQLVIPSPGPVLPDHGHPMHLFLVQWPGALAHLHPVEQADGSYVANLPSSLPAGSYMVFADIVLPSGFPVTGTARLDLLTQECDPLVGDDSAWQGKPGRETAELGGGLKMIWNAPVRLVAGQALSLQFLVIADDGSPVALEPYMGMAGHAEIVRSDAAVFAHIHPSGSVPMPALALAQRGATPGDMPDMPDMPDMAMTATKPLPASVTFPYGFPSAGDYVVFVQVKHAGGVLTGAFTATVKPAP